jgi:serine/threonine-protein kinase PRP4
VVGKGVFSTVLKCVDLRGGDGNQHVAIKMIRNNDTMRKAAEKEKSILSEIAEKDPENRSPLTTSSIYVHTRYLDVFI